jgi:hypothetical protein
LDQNSVDTANNQVSTILQEPRETPVTVSINNPYAVNDALSKNRKTFYVDLLIGNNELNSLNNSSSYPYSKNDVSTTWTSAKGLKNAPKNGTSLVSEEGPELV